MKTDISVDEAIACYARIEPVQPKLVPLNEAIGLRVARDVRMRRSAPTADQLAVDGWPVASGHVALATRRKPVLLPANSTLFDKGTVLPAGCDAVLPMASVAQGRSGPAALHAVDAGDGVTVRGAWYGEGEVLLHAGRIVTMTAAMAGAVCGVNEVMVRRPIVDIIINASGIMRHNDKLLHVITAAVRGSGSEIGAVHFTMGEPREFADAVLSSSADVIATVGGTGSGPSDTTLPVLRDIGEVIFHGVRMQPGGTVALSIVNDRPVFSIPGSLADIVAVNLLLTPSFARRAFGRPARSSATLVAKLLTPFAASPKQTQLLFATLSDAGITVLAKANIGGAELRPLQLAGANAAVVVQEGSRHRRVGEKVAYLRLGNVM
jgi:molybdopterin molybdotransferase